jgi:hypothetical protein
MSEEEKSAIREQLERLLGNPHFSHSRRFPSFLRYVVEVTLSGQEAVLKERTLGAEIFGRLADYDTASDPIVRVTAAEIRKRIAQYYQEAGHEGELRISLPPGSYIPQFQDAAVVHEDPAELASLKPVLPEAEPATAAPPKAAHKRWSWKLLLALPTVIALAGGAAWLWQRQQPSPFDLFWGPVLKADNPVLFCIADQQQYASIELRDANDQNKLTILPDNLTAVVIDDLSPIVHAAGLLQSRGIKYGLRAESATSLMDLRNGPTIFVGAFDNAWTLRLTRPLRYHFANNPEMTDLGIVDGTSGGAKRWMVNRPQQMATNNYRDYAIVARFTDSITGEVAVVIAGVARGGTIAAGEFLTDPSNLAAMMRATKKSGRGQNLEVVLSTQIIGGEPGTPKMEAAYSW